MDIRNLKEFINDCTKYIITFFVVIFIVMYVVTLQQIVGNSMQPNYMDGDIVVLNKLHYKFFKIKRFDVISLKYDDTKYLIKRVIGLPGDKIKYQNNQLYVNGEMCKEEFLSSNIMTEDFSFETTIDDDMYFVLGDNRSDSLDSRQFGLVHAKDILGKVSLRIWPILR